MTVPPDLSSFRSDGAPGGGAWAALHASAVVAPLPAVGAVRLTGPDRSDFLHGQAAADVRTAPPGGSVRTLFLDVKGHARWEARVQRRKDDLHLAVEDGAAAAVAAHLSRHVIFDAVEVHDLSGTLATVTVQGPRVDAVLAALGTGVPEADRFVAVPFENGELLIHPARRSEAGGVDVHLLAPQRPAVLEALQRAGAVG
ncbi:MAG: hypothetical protein WD336_03215, partial [Trueperaceae bacterium]